MTMTMPVRRLTPHGFDHIRRAGAAAAAAVWLSTAVAVWAQAPVPQPDPATEPAAADQVTAPTESAPTSQEDRQEQPPARRRFNLAIGPGIRLERAADDGTVGDIDVSVMLTRRAGDGAAQVFSIFNGRSGRGGLAPAIRVGIRPRSTDIVSDTHASATPLGRLSLRPLMGGVSWLQPLRPKVSLDVFGVTGVALTSFTANTGDDWDANDRRVALPTGIADADHAWATEIGARVWFDVHPRLAITTGASWFQARPRLLLSDGSSHRWDASRARVELGLAISLFGGRK